MKQALIVLLLLLASTADAAYYQLQSCEYKYIPEIGQSKYIGTYKSSFGNYFTAYFDSYCPPVINQ